MSGPDQPPVRVFNVAQGLERLKRLVSNRLVTFTIKLILSGGLIAMVCRTIQPVTIIEEFESQSPWWLAVAAFLTGVQILLGALRWDQILAALGAALPIQTVLYVTYISSFFTSWLLGVVGGDSARAMLIPAHIRRRAIMVHSVLFDRILSVAALGLVVLPGVIFDVGPFAREISLFLVLAAAALPLVGMTVIGWMARSVTEGPDSSISGHIAGLAHSWRHLLRARGRFFATLAISATGQLVLAGVAYSLARAQHLDTSFFDFLMLMPPVVLLVTLPISVGGWGVRENAMVTGLAVIGVASSSALLISIEMGVLAALLSLPAGAMWVFRYGIAKRLPVATSL